MYDELDFIALTKGVADGVIAYERAKYKPFYKLIVDFIKREQVFLAGNYACRAFDARTIDLDGIVLDAAPFLLFSADAYETGKALIREIENTPHLGNINTVHLYPSIADYEYQLNMSGRRLATIKMIGEHRGVPLGKLIRPPQIDGVSLISADIMIIDIYRRIFSKSDDNNNSEHLMQLEKRLFDRFYTDSKKSDFIPKPVVGLAETKALTLRRRALELFPEHLVVGPQAFESTPDMDELQIVVSDLDSEIASKLSSLGCLVNRYFISLPIDSRLRRFRVVLEGATRTTIIDVFNAGSYDLLHRTHPFTLYRFCLVDIWTLRLIAALGEINQSTAERQIERIVKRIHSTRNRITPLDNVGVEDFFGTFVDETIALRRERKYAKRDTSQIVYVGSQKNNQSA
jgi:hypothetical protein